MSETDGISAAMVPLEKLVCDAEDRPDSQLKGQGIKDLAESIKARGIIAPIVITKREDGSFSVISGKRRVAALKLLKQKTAPAVVRPSGDTLDVITANFFHAPTPSVRRARMLKALLDEKVYKNQKEIAQAMGVSESTISRMLSFLDLPAEVQEEIDKGEITPSTTYAGGKKRRLAMSATEVHEDLRIKRFVPLPPENLVGADSAALVPVKIGVSPNQVRIQITIPLQSVKTEGLAKALAREIHKIGDKDLSKAISSYAKEMFDLEATKKPEAATK